MPKYFLITGLPRSRTAWLAALFCTGDVICFHEPVLKFGGDLDRMKKYFDSLPHKYVGISDCSMGLQPDFYLTNFEKAPIVYIERNIIVVNKKLQEFLSIDAVEAKRMIDKVWPGALTIHKNERTLHVQYEYLDYTNYIRDIWQHCTNEPFDDTRCEILQNLIINQDKGKVLTNLNK